MYFVKMKSLVALLMLIHGTAEVIDGDTINVQGQIVRLAGIDAPELDQACLHQEKKWPCGNDAASVLRRLIGRHYVCCNGAGRDRYRRLLAMCFVDGQNLNKMMVSTGWAMLYRGRDPHGWAWQEKAARLAKIGIWRDDVEPPWQWRKR